VPGVILYVVLLLIVFAVTFWIDSLPA